MKNSPLSTPNSPLIKEACVEGIEQSIKSAELGANRIELCDRLDVGGTTPSVDVIQQVMAAIDIPIRVMIRPRGGDFIYNEMEIESMKLEIDACKKLGVEGVVFGMTTTEKTLDIPLIEILAKRAYPLKVVVHKAIDTCTNPIAEVKRLKEIKEVTAVLSSGGKKTAKEGQGILAEMVRIVGNDLTIVVAGKVTNENLAELHELIQSTDYHGTKVVGVLK